MNDHVTGAAPMHRHEDGVPCYHPHHHSLAPAVVIGLTGYAQSGKDTSASFMAELGFERLAFADKLKDLALAADPSFVVPDWCHNDEPHTCLPLSFIVEEAGWEYAKADVPGVREFLQNLGVGVRDVIGSDTWVRAVMDQIRPGGRYVITDVRFPNELDAIRAAGGVIVRVRRPGTKAPNGHVSEAFDGSEADLAIDNDGDLDDLRTHALHVAELLVVA